MTTQEQTNNLYEICFTPLSLALNLNFIHRKWFIPLFLFLMKSLGTHSAGTTPSSTQTWRENREAINDTIRTEKA